MGVSGALMEVPAGATIAECVPAAERGGVVAARVNGRVVDLATRLERGGPVDCVTAESPEGLALIRHSAAHLMAAAVEALFPGTRFAIGPAIEDGFYYDVEPPRPLAPEDLPAIEAKMAELRAAGLPYVRREVPIGEALEHFRRLGQPYKVEILETLAAHPAGGELAGEADPSGERVSFYETGPFVDLCRGPHVPETRAIRAFKLTHLAGAYWRGDERRPMLTRIYGTAFASPEALAVHLQRLEEARRRDHRRLGRELELFTIVEEVGPGLPLWLPRGATVRRVLERYIVDLETAEGYQHVYTPPLARVDLYQISGHWDHYRENMYPVMTIDNDELVLRPMNCPHHFMIYKHQQHSYRSLPIRIAELGLMHRYERSGVLTGLSRVRGMTLNDAHIFCRPDQLKAEFTRVVRLILRVYQDFGIERFWHRLSLYDPAEPRKYAAEAQMWEQAERVLREAMEEMGLPCVEAVGEASFYGPKLDVQVETAQGKDETLSTVQIDMYLPERFALEYIGEDGRPHRPVVIHRGVISTMERMVAFLIEHYGGAFPTWLAPVQVRLLPIADRHHALAGAVAETLRAAGVRVEVDARNEKVGFKVREAEVEKVPYTLVIGDRELAEGTVAVRARGGTDRGRVTAAAFLETIRPELQPPRA
jgi:threonyl-tRNA synthetase